MLSAEGLAETTQPGRERDEMFKALKKDAANREDLLSKVVLQTDKS